MKRKELSIDKKIVDGLILSVFVVFVFIPIFTMLRRITTDGFISIINSAQFPLAIKNSMATTLVSTVLSISLAFIASWCIERINIKHREIFEVLFTVPMLVPSISHAFGLVALFGSNGILTNLLKLNFSIYGFWGIVVGSVMYSFPVAFLMFLERKALFP